MRLLLVEDDLIFGEGLRDFLRGEGHVVDWCTRLAQAQLLVSEPFDAWLLDWNLPDGSGAQWLQKQRAQGAQTLALMLTARDRLAERIEGLDSGADDYLVKPFAPEELSARLRAFSRRVSAAGTQLAWGDLTLDIAGKVARNAGHTIELTAREWAVIEALSLRQGRVVSRRDLEALVCGFDQDPASNLIDVHIYKLRSKLGKDLIETVRGLGYRLLRPS